MDDAEYLTSETLDTLRMCKVNTSFMSMAINRTVDFTKSASNIMLQAKKETVSLFTAINWAVNCVRCSMHDGITISIEPIPSEICRHIVTDKHW